MYSERVARRNGKKDGRRGIPRINDEKHSDYVCRLLQAGEDNIREVVKKFYEFMGKNESKLATVKNPSDPNDPKGEGTDNRLFQIVEDKIKDVVQRFYDFMGKNEGRLNTAKSSLDTKRKALDKKKELIDQYDEKVPLGKFGYWFIFTFIALVESPVNFMAFSIFESPIFTAILAAGLSLGVPIMAHFLGSWFKEGRRGWNRELVIKICITLAVTIAAILAIAYVREKLFETDEDIKKLMDPTALTFVFISINLFLFALATVASTFAHYSNPDIAVHLKEYEKLDRDVNDLSGRYNQLKGGVINTAKKFRTEAEQEADNVMRNYNLAWADIVNMAKKSKAETEQIVDRVEGLIDIYEQENMRARYEGFFKRVFNATIFWNREHLKKKEPDRPQVFDTYPPVVIPQEFLGDVGRIITKQSPTVIIPSKFLEDVERVISDHQ